MNKSDKKFMNEAIKLSFKGMKTNQGGPFGAVIVKNGKIVGS
jgi:tRNA(Arg) A34 adenosine deaminase TadA